jgi:hypothetical protein
MASCCRYRPLATGVGLQGFACTVTCVAEFKSGHGGGAHQLCEPVVMASYRTVDTQLVCIVCI